MCRLTRCISRSSLVAPALNSKPPKTRCVTGSAWLHSTILCMEVKLLTLQCCCSISLLRQVPLSTRRYSQCHAVSDMHSVKECSMTPRQHYNVGADHPV